MAQDFFGNTIKEGDTVAFMVVGYRSFTLGTIEKITEKYLALVYDEKGCKSRCKQRHDQVIKHFKIIEPRYANYANEFPHLQTKSPKAESILA